MSKEEIEVNNDRVALNDAHEKFVQVYCELLNGTQAYLQVYPKCSYGSAAANASRLLKKDNVKERILEVQELFAAKTKQDKNKTIQELLVVAEEARRDENYAAYAKIRDMIIKMCGMYEAKKLEVEAKGFTLNYIKPKKD